MSDYTDLIARLAEVAWLAEEGSEVTDLANDAREAIGQLRAEVERLTRWKAEAMAVIDQWEAAWEAAGSPGELGDTKSGAMRAAILAERALADQLAEALKGHPHQFPIPNDDEWAITVQMRRVALAAWEAAREPGS